MVDSYAEAAVKQANFENRKNRDPCRHCGEDPCQCDRIDDRIEESRLEG